MTEPTPQSLEALVEMRLQHLETAYITLLERVMVLERRSRLDADQLQDVADQIRALAGLRVRVDHLERPHTQRRPLGEDGGAV